MTGGGVAHVWVKEQHGPNQWPGLVLDWRQGEGGWSALVTYRREGPQVFVTEWVEQQRLTPVLWRPTMGTAYG